MDVIILATSDIYLKQSLMSDVTIDTTNLTTNNSKSVYESLVTIDYIDAIANAPSENLKLVPSDPYLAAKCRIWADKVNRECCSPYYGVLVRTDDNERKEHFNKLVDGLKSFSREIEKSGGNSFLGDGRLSSVDIALMPWAWRYYIFEHYRGHEYAIPYNIPELHAYKAWYDHVFSLESVKRTLPDKDRYLVHIGKYADAR
jgi:glutathione S-transferase